MWHTSGERDGWQCFYKLQTAWDPLIAFHFSYQDKGKLFSLWHARAWVWFCAKTEDDFSVFISQLIQGVVLFIKTKYEDETALMAIFTCNSQKKLVGIENRYMWKIWSPLFRKNFSFWYVKPDILIIIFLSKSATKLREVCDSHGSVTAAKVKLRILQDMTYTADWRNPRSIASHTVV